MLQTSHIKGVAFLHIFDKHSVKETKKRTASQPIFTIHTFTQKKTHKKITNKKLNINNNKKTH